MVLDPHYFWPQHLKMYSDVKCILLFDNCSAHKIDTTLLPEHLTIKFLTQNVTNAFQPANMRMIASPKVGHKSLYL